MSDQLNEWLHRAQGDFDAARDVLNSSGEFRYYSVCVSCQQATEKLIKAVLVKHNIGFDKIHDLVKLTPLALSVIPEWEAPMDDLQYLTYISGQARYPESVIDPEDAQQAFEIASRIRAELLPYFHGEAKPL
jgi:HEPN domain-containing protein